LLELAKAMNELRDMFQDMAALLELQGENINSIDKNMDSAQDYVDRGIVHLDKATKYQKKKRKQMCCCLLLGLIAAGVIITPILVDALDNA
jgi:syntaxin 1B/2/3